MIASLVVAVLLSLRIITLAQLRARGGSSSAFHADLANCKYDDDDDCVDEDDVCDDNNFLLCDTN